MLKYRIRGKRGDDMSVTAPVGNTLSIDEIEKGLGLDKIEPIILTSSEVDDDFDKDKEYFKDMYEDEIRELFKKI